MRQADILAAEREARRFIDAVDRFRERHAKDQQFRDYMEITGFKETGAVRRASLDLTRSLAEMRKP
jgi:hypothetical protein